MSDRRHDSLIRAPIHARFPSAYIEAFGLGIIGRVYLTLSTDGSTTKAEANLYDAPYKRMLIDDPRILRVFGGPEDSIDMSILHPRPRFRLDPTVPTEDENGDLAADAFDVGRLVDITEMPPDARYGWPKYRPDLPQAQEEGEVHKRIRERMEKNNAQTTLKRSASSSTKVKVEPDVDDARPRATLRDPKMEPTSS